MVRVTKGTAGLWTGFVLVSLILGVCFFSVGTRLRTWAPRTGDQGCSQAEPSSHPLIDTSGELVGLRADLVVDGLDEPTDMLQLPGRDVLLVAEKPGRIVAVSEGRVLEAPVLDISEKVSSDWNERGLLTIEPHPDFATTCELFLFYTDVDGHSNLMSAIVGGNDLPSIDPASLRQILLVYQNHQYHQSGSMTFGPDGYLWVSIGDGGGGGSGWNSQNTMSLKGSILRLDVQHRPYGIPPDNPYVASSRGAREVWASGVRNPWRISIDSETGLLFLPDTGYHLEEELNVVSVSASGLNFGWPYYEGLSCSVPAACGAPGFARPVLTYKHEDNGCAIVGGQVYRGGSIPELHGHYFYADFCRGWIKSLVYEDGVITAEADWTSDLESRSHITSFSEDSHGELYFTNLNGELWKIVARRE